MAVDKVPYGRLTQNIKMHSIYGDLVVQFLNWFTQKTEGRRLERCYFDCLWPVAFHRDQCVGLHYL